MKRIRWSDLHAFSLVARHRSFRHAALAIGVTAAGLSRTISGLEHRLGLRLLNRTTRSVALTEAGAWLFDYLAPALEDIEGAIEKLNEFRGTSSGQLRIHVDSHTHQVELVPIVERFMCLYPAITVEINADHTLRDFVAAGFDVGLRDSQDVPRDMVAMPFRTTCRWIVVAAPAYVATHQLPREPADLRGHHTIRHRLASGEIQAWEFMCAGRRVSIAPTGSITLNDYQAELSAAMAGLGYMYVQEFHARALLESERLVQVLADWCQPGPALSLYYPSRRHMPAPVRAFIDFVRSEAPTDVQHYLDRGAVPALNNFATVNVPMPYAGTSRRLCDSLHE